MKDKDIKYLNGGARLTFDGDGWAINVFDNSNAFWVGDWRDIIISAVGSGQVIVHGSNQKNPPDFKQPSTFSNVHAPITLADLSIPNTYYAGTAGTNVTNSTQLTEVNTNMLTWIAFERKSTAVNVKVSYTNAQ